MVAILSWPQSGIHMTSSKCVNTCALWEMLLTNPPHWWNIQISTHLPMDKMAAISQTIFSDAFLWIKRFGFWLKFQWSMSVRVQLTIGLDNGLVPHKATCHYLNQCWPISLMHICGTRGNELNHHVSMHVSSASSAVKIIQRTVLLQQTLVYVACIQCSMQSKLITIRVILLDQCGACIVQHTADFELQIMLQAGILPHINKKCYLVGHLWQIWRC